MTTDNGKNSPCATEDAEPTQAEATIEAMRSKRAEISLSDAEIFGLKAKLKEATSRRDRLVSELLGFLNPLPLFDDPPAPPDDKPSDAWKDEKIIALSLPDSINRALDDMNLTTIGKLAEYSKAGLLLTDIPGIGEGKAQKIEDALEHYWKTHRPPPDPKELDSEDDTADDGTES